MAGSDFRAFLYGTDQEHADTVMKPIKSGATFKSYALVVQDVSGGGSDGTIDEVGADPASVLGIVMSDAVDTNTPYINVVSPATKMAPVVVLRPSVKVGMAVNAALLATDEEKDYGIVKLASGNWVVDKSETVNTRVHIHRAARLDAGKELAIVTFLAANLQGDSIAS